MGQRFVYRIDSSRLDTAFDVQGELPAAARTFSERRSALAPSYWECLVLKESAGLIVTREILEIARESQHRENAQQGSE